MRKNNVFILICFAFLITSCCKHRELCKSPSLIKPQQDKSEIRSLAIDCFKKQYRLKVLHETPSLAPIEEDRPICRAGKGVRSTLLTDEDEDKIFDIDK